MSDEPNKASTLDYGDESKVKTTTGQAVKVCEVRGDNAVVAVPVLSILHSLGWVIGLYDPLGKNTSLSAVPMPTLVNVQ